MLRITLSANGSLYCCSDGVRGRGAAVKYLSHNASFHSKEKIAPSNRGIKHLVSFLMFSHLYDSIQQTSGGLKSNLYRLSIDQIVRLQPYFPMGRGRALFDDRCVLSGLIFNNRNGLRWCDAPKECGPYKTSYNRWKRWSDVGVFARIMEGACGQSP